ncbi:ABC transporter permease [Microbacterium sp. 18062]|uniref:ABC transporter permease n=1 Tax=Microbacterium sp. 18062 TaxID=2681410 RepID=UPI001356ABD9|nr:ABC transporter permease [Microbacterium sp. 18062]
MTTTENTTATLAVLDSGRLPSRAALAFLGRSLLVVGFGTIVVAIVEVLTATGLISPLVMPRPSLVASRVVDILTQVLTGGASAAFAWQTASALLVSLVVAVGLGVAIGTLLAQSRLAMLTLYPYVLALNAAPRVVFAPMFVIWFGLGMTSRVVMAVSIGMFPVIVGTLAGLARAEGQTHKLMAAAGASRFQRFRLVEFPSALPFIVAGSETAAVLVAVGVVIGEFTAGNEGLGYLVIVAQENYDLPTVFALVVIIALMGILLNGLVMLLGRRFVFWGRAQS